MQDTAVQTQYAQKYHQVMAQAWEDPAFKQRLLADPAAVLRERGIETPPGMQVRVLEDTAQVVHLVLPRQTDELSAQQLDQVAGGARDKDE